MGLARESQKKDFLSSGSFEFFIYFLIILQNYTIVSKIGCRRRLQDPHGGRQPSCNHRAPWRLHVANLRGLWRLFF
jgi:hypothetical protein